MDTELLKTGCLIMVLGMGTVYFFIVIMTLSMQLSSKLLKFINKYFPEEIPEIKKIKKNKPDETDIAIAIAAAIQKGGHKC